MLRIFCSHLYFDMSGDTLALKNVLCKLNAYIFYSYTYSQQDYIL